MVDSSELAFRLATIGAFREAFKSAKAAILEPIMTVEVVAPSEFQSAYLPFSCFIRLGSFVVDRLMIIFLNLIGSVIGGLNTRRGTIVDSEVRDEEFTATAEVALNDMFGYSNQLRGSTQGKGTCQLSSVLFLPFPNDLSTANVSAGEFSMEYKHHLAVLPQLQKELEEDYRKTLPAAKK